MKPRGGPPASRLVALPIGRAAHQAAIHRILRAPTGELRILRTPIDLPVLDRELSQGQTPSQSSGEIGEGARGPGAGDAGPEVIYQENPPQDDTLPITLEVYPGTPQPAATPAPPPPPVDEPEEESHEHTGHPDDILDAGVPLPAGVPEPEPEPAPAPAPTPAPPPPAPARPRALIVGGIHGNERGPLDIMTQLQSELRSTAAPLRRDFDTLVIPIMNPGGVADGTRENRRGVDLNRNFPGLSGFPAPSGRVPPRQPEVQAVMNVVQTMHPARILALHAIGSAGSTSSPKGGVFADPVEGAARELACRMALRMRGGSLGSGGTVTDVNTQGSELANQVCNSRYPETSAVSVTTAQSSLGAWGSAPVAVGGQGTTVITHETAGKAALPATGDRSVATVMPGIREFLRDNRRAPSEADALLRGAVSDAFLTGEGTTTADRNLLAAVERIVRARFNDLAAFYKDVWRPAQLASHPSVRLPRRLTGSQTRDFSSQAGIMRGQLGSLTASSTPTEIETAITTAMQTRSMPGFSRHHWGTEIDVIDATRTRWTGSGNLVPVIPFLQSEASRFGFFHPYATGAFPSPSQHHYLDEPWHLSYWPLANVIANEWRTRMVGATLDALIVRTADAIRGSVPRATMVSVLSGMGLTQFQTNVAPSP